jgi:hypothetical protein
MVYFSGLFSRGPHPSSSSIPTLEPLYRARYRIRRLSLLIVSPSLQWQRLDETPDDQND